MKKEKAEYLRHPHIEEGVKKYYTAILRFLSKKTSNIETAKELTQDVVRKALQHSNSYTPEKDNAKSWLLQIATNVFRDHTRKQKHRRTISLDDDSSEGTEILYNAALKKPQTDEIVASRIELERVRQAMNALPEIQSDAICAQLEGQSLNAIARSRDTRPNTIKTRIRRGKKSLKPKEDLHE